MPVHLYAASSYPCENTASIARAICNGRNDITMVKTKLKDLKLLEIIKDTTGFGPEPRRVNPERTSLVLPHIPLTFEEQGELWTTS